MEQGSMGAGPNLAAVQEHHQVASLGSLLRLQMGDPTALQSLGANLAGFLANRQAGMQAAQQLPTKVTQDPRMQVVMALTEQSNNQVAQNLPVLMQTVQLSGGPAVRPLLVGNP